jgi:hemerythrin-like domain-containing protein
MNLEEKNMDIYSELKKDHDKIKPMLEKLVSASEMNEDTKTLLGQIRDELVPHARAEEAVFYNSLREIQGCKELVRHSYNEHMKAETILRTLQGMAAINVEWTAAAKKLKEELEHHIAEEEGKIFTAARQALLDEESKQMANAFKRMKPEIKDQGMMKDTLDMVANLMPNRFQDKVRNFKEKQN